MNHSFNPLAATRKHLVNQLVFFDEQYPNFIDLYLSGFSNHEKKSMDELLRKYTASLSDMLGSDDSALREMLNHVVLIGSKVKVEFAEDNTTDSFTVVYPTESDPDTNRVSFISPIGRQLLGATCNAPLVLEVPAGRQHILIREIKYAYIGGFVDQ